MGYSYLYIFCVLILLMFLIRIFLPFIVYLIPILFIVFVLKSIFSKKEKHTYEYKEEYSENMNSSPDIIDVDYKVVDEKETDTH